MISEQNQPSLPHVTIIVPVYNAENYITETLDSAFSQTYKNFDVVCVDDCSTDNTFEIIEECTLEKLTTRENFWQIHYFHLFWNE